MKFFELLKMKFCVSFGLIASVIALYRSSDIVLQKFRKRFLELAVNIFENWHDTCKWTLQNWVIIFKSFKKARNMNAMAKRDLIFDCVSWRDRSLRALFEYVVV